MFAGAHRADERGHGPSGRGCGGRSRTDGDRIVVTAGVLCAVQSQVDEGDPAVEGAFGKRLDLVDIGEA